MPMNGRQSERCRFREQQGCQLKLAARQFMTEAPPVHLPRIASLHRDGADETDTGQLNQGSCHLSFQVQSCGPRRISPVLAALSHTGDAPALGPCQNAARPPQEHKTIQLSLSLSVTI